MQDLFIKEVCTYFQNFLETDFKSRRSPKRSLNLKDKAGNLTALRLEKYPLFQKQVFELINSKSIEFQIEVPRNKFTTSFSNEVTDLVAAKIIKNTSSSIEEVLEGFDEAISDIFIRFESDSEIFIQESLISLQSLINELITLPSLTLIDGTIKRLKESEEDDSAELSVVMTNFFIGEFESEIKDNLKTYFIEKTSEKVIESVVHILSEEHLLKSTGRFLDSFALTDIHSEFSELSRSKKLAEGLELYFYFGELVYNKIHYPLFFIPFELTEEVVKNKKVYKIKFDTRYYINKSAIEYVYQMIGDKNTPAEISSIIGDRIQYVDESSTLASSLNLKTDELLGHLGLAGNVEFTEPTINVASSGELRLNNKSSVALFDKSDESALNDYEELIEHLDQNSRLGEIFSSLVSNFINEEPEQIIENVLDEWDDTTTPDRLVFSSPIPLNEEQRKILSSINNSKSTYITVQGPPGTGKSHTITAILFEAILKDKSVLLLSDKKEALDVVEDKITQALDIIRTNSNFQNPILRLGRQGATFNKILTTKNLEMIRTHLRASKSEVSGDQVEKNKNQVKQRVTSYIEGYENVGAPQISEYIQSKRDLGVDEEAETQIIDNTKYFQEIYDGFGALKELLSHDSLVEIAKKNEFVSIDDMREFLQIMDSTTGIELNEDFRNVFHGVNLDNKKILQHSIVQYSETHSKLFAFLFANSQLVEWNKNLNERLDLVEYVDFRKENNFSLLKSYTKFVSEVGAHTKKYEDERSKKLIIYLSSNELDISRSDCLGILDRLSTLTRALSIWELHPALLKNVIGCKVSNNSNILTLKVDLILDNLNKILSFAGLVVALRSAFSNIDEVYLAEQSRQIQKDATAVMANKFDSRFIKFIDNNKTKANTLKKIISKKQKFPKSDLELLRNAFPCIIAGIRDYADYIPLEPEIFDLIVIDEASQVSIAQAFPAILRAKKVVVMGDKRQFSNVKSSNASKKINSGYQDNIRKSFLEAYGNDPQKKERSKVFNIRVSILEFFENIANYDCLLKKHFRGYPEIISFSSKYFYDNELQAIKVRVLPIEEVVSIKQIEHDGQLEIHANTNKLESDYIVEEIIKICEMDKPPSVAVITPMRAQQKFIFSEIENAINYDDIEKINLKVMTFDSCQGEERDIVFYSFVDAPDKDVSFRVLGSKFDLTVMDPEENLRLQRLNVGMSRAKEKIELVISKPIDEMKGNAKLILSHYQQEIESARSLPEINELDSPMEIKVLDWIKQSDFYQNNRANIEIKAQFEIGKYLKKLDPRYDHPDYRTDFLMTFNDGEKTKNLVIEYDGFTEHFVDLENVNEFNYAHYYNKSDVEREKTIEAYGFPFLRLNKFNLGKEPHKTISKKLNSFFLIKKKTAI